MDLNEVIWIGSAFFSGFLAMRLYLPPLVGYLAAGYLLHALAIPSLPHLNTVSDLGIQLLLFTVGLKIKPKSLLKKEVLTVGGLHLIVMAVLSGWVFVWLDHKITGGLMLGISLAFSSTVFAIKALEDNGELSSMHGRDILSILILQDLIAIALLGYLKNTEPSPWAFTLFAIPLCRPLAHRILSACHFSELKLLMGVWLAILGGLLAENVGITPDIGALLMGVMLADHEKTEDLSQKLWGLKEIFLVAFFMQIGLSNTPNHSQLVQAVMLLALLPIQGVIFFFLYLVSGLRARTAFISAMVLMTYSEFALITTHAIIDAGLLPAEWQTIIGLAVAGSLALAAPLNKLSNRLFNHFESFLLRFEKHTHHTDDLPLVFDGIEWLIIGMGRTGLAAYETLSAQKLNVMGLDADPTVIDVRQTEGRHVQYADVSDSELWTLLPLQTVKGIILTLPSFEHRINAIGQLRKRHFAGYIGTICYQIDDEELLKTSGATFTIQPLVEAGHQLAHQMLVFNRKPI